MRAKAAASRAVSRAVSRPKCGRPRIIHRESNFLPRIMHISELPDYEHEYVVAVLLFKLIVVSIQNLGAE